MSTAIAEERTRPPVPALIVLLLVIVLPFVGKGGMVASLVLASVLFGVPLFVLMGFVTVLCFALFAGYGELHQFGVLIERIRTLADNSTLLAIPMFMASGTVMARGQISARLIGFAMALVGWMPGGLAISAVLACMLFAAISGSSPATVVAIGGMMAPALIKRGYDKRFSHGLVTSAGSLGILIPPSIPMIVYPIVNQTSNIEVTRLFMAGFGPGFVIGGTLMAYSVYRGIVDKTPRETFTLRRLFEATRDGFWSLMFPVLILGGLQTGIFTEVEAAGFSVVYAVAIELWVHRAIKPSELPAAFGETGVLLGSFLVVMVSALAFTEFLQGQNIPDMAVAWLRSFDLTRTQFLLAVNLFLLVVGMFMDILSAMMVFVPLLAPMAASFGIDPIHFGIIFIVNLELGYLTPPVGLNLFVASTMFKEPLGHIVRSVVPFIAVMAVGLAVVTSFPELSVGLSNTLLGRDEEAPAPAPLDTPTPTETPTPQPNAGAGGVMTMEEMMRAAQKQDGAPAEGGSGRVMTMEEMMRAAEQKDEAAPAPATPAAPPSGRVLTMEEMMRAAEQPKAE